MITLLLTLPFTIVFGDSGFGPLLFLLFLLMIVTVHIPIMGIFFGDQVFLFCNPDTIGELQESDLEAMEDDVRWGTPNKIHKWFRAWARGMMSLLYICIPRFIISLPLLVLLLLTIASSGQLRTAPMVFVRTFTGLILWAIAGPPLAGILGSWLLRKMFARWELYRLLHPGRLVKKLPHPSSKEALKQFQANSRKPTKARKPAQLCKKNSKNTSTESAKGPFSPPSVD